MTKKTALYLSFFLILIGITGRLMPHLPNVVPMTAIALFCAAYLSFRQTTTVFLVTMVATDMIIGFYQWEMMLAVYGSFICSILIGLSVRKHVTMPRILLATVSSSVLFFLVTNWAVWQFGTMYVHSFSGLMESYAMAIPFFKNSLFGDLFYSITLLGMFRIAFYVSTPCSRLKCVTGGVEGSKGGRDE